MKTYISTKDSLFLKLVALFYLLIAVIAIPECQAKKNQDSHKFKKILVLAKVQQSNIEQNFEDAVVSALKDKGYEAMPSYNTFTKSEVENTDRLIKKADSMQIDAVLAFTLIGVETKVINTPQVSASVGVPVRIGFFSVFVGGSVPLGGGPVEEKVVKVKAGFYTDRNTTVPSWTITLSGNLADGTDALIYSFVRKTIKTLFKQKVL